MLSAKIADTLVDLAPFVLYSAVLIKIFRSWRLIKSDAEAHRRHRLAAVLMLLTLVIACFLASNVYALAVYGKTYLSLFVFQMFIIGNCLVYWLVIDILTKDSLPAQGMPSESTD